MFSSKREFIKEYTTRLSQRYGNSVDDAHPTELYDVLGEMVRDYAGKFWRETKDNVVKKEKKMKTYKEELNYLKKP